ncbi:CD1375 family protein [Clostridium sp.]|uniref:CD1375 family protein n=1 Tax=Clostridium sp. TaxID=1506 RepID=UPI0035A06A4C
MLKVKLFILKYILRKEVDEMAAVYATLIIKGLKTFAEVPELVKPKVKEALEGIDMGELAQ